MNLRGLRLNGSLILAPMAGVTDIAFRSMSRDAGAALVFTEMVSANALIRGSPRTMRHARNPPDEPMCGLQLFGAKPEILEKAIRKIEEEYAETICPALYDLNLGCPVRKVTMRGAGSALLEHPDKVEDLVKSMRNATDRPISAKMRLGITEGAGDPLAVARATERGGADMLIVHARYADEGYAGEARWEWIRRIVGEVGIPVAGNGDVRDGMSAQRMLEDTGCALAMVGRAAEGDPYVFARIKMELEGGGELPQRDQQEMFSEYYRLARHWGLKDGVVKRQAMLFSKGLDDAKRVRARIKELSEPEEILAAVMEGEHF